MRGSRQALSLALLTLLGACASKPHTERVAKATRTAKRQDTPPLDDRSFTFSAMGTVWHITIGDSEGKSVSMRHLQRLLRDEAILYDTTFSDWSNTSELRKLERQGLDHTHTPSALFLQGLKISREAYDYTEGAFDITVGAVIWKEAREAVGMKQLLIEGRSFHFKKNPRRLTFGGIAKGLLIGEMASQLWTAGLRNFHINGGNGNLALAGDDYGEAWQEVAEPGSVYVSGHILFLSNSSSHQGSQQHILDPANPARKLNRSARVICAAGEAEIDSWDRISGLTDALSTALVVNPELKTLPVTCQSSVSQSDDKRD